MKSDKEAILIYVDGDGGYADSRACDTMRASIIEIAMYLKVNDMKLTRETLATKLKMTRQRLSRLLVILGIENEFKRIQNK